MNRGTVFHAWPIANTLLPVLNSGFGAMKVKGLGSRKYLIDSEKARPRA
jgi:hypothetical protein